MSGLQSNRSVNQASGLGNDGFANVVLRSGGIVSASSKRLLATASFVLFGFAAEVQAQNYPGLDALNAAVSAYALNPTEVNKQAIESAKAQLRNEIKDDGETDPVDDPNAPNRSRENITSGYKSIYVIDAGRAIWNGIDNSAVVVGASAAFFITSEADREDGNHDVQFTNNISALGVGGAIRNHWRLLLDRVRFVENEALQGGAIYNFDTATITGSHFVENKSEYTGGAIYNFGTATITGSHFVENKSEYTGGAIYNFGTATITDSHFERNEAQYGGAIYNASTATITDSHFERNEAQYGGAIYNASTATITDSHFEGNEAKQSGGAIYNSRTATITGSHFKRNEAQYGVAIYNSRTATITDSHFEGNEAKQSGGAIYNDYTATATITNSRFERNKAQSNGGASYNFGTATITGSYFEGNEARYYGGAIYNSGTVTIKDSVFQGNTAQQYGGAIFIDYNSNTTLEVTGAGQRFLFSGNLAQGISNSVHLAITPNFDTILNVDVADRGVMDMRDPMNSSLLNSSGPGFSSTTITKDGLGEWRLGGTSNLNFYQGKTNIDFSVNEGSLYLYGAGEVANANVNDANAKVEAGVIAINRQQGGIDGQASVFSVASEGTIVAAGENSIVVDGTINLAHGATIRGGTASDHDEGHTLIALGGETSLDLTASGGVLVEGTLNVAAVEERDTFRLNAALQAVPGADADIVKTGAGTLILNGSENYTGKIDVQAGKLSIENQLGVSQLDIRNGAVLAGNGTIGQSLDAEVIIASGGILAPGNSIGRLDIDGNLSLLSGSVYAVEIEGSGASDLTHVLGSLTIADGATMTVTGLDPEASYQSGQTYVVLSSANAINGAFTQTISGSAFLEAGSVTDGNEVIATIKVKSDTPDPKPEPEPQPEPKPAPDVFTRAAKTENQRNVAGGLNSLKQSGPSLALYNKLLLLSEEEARAAFDSLSGEVHASAKTAMLDDGGHIRSAVSSRLRRAFDDSYSHEQGDAGSLSQYGGWAQAYGSWSRISSDGNAAGLNSSVGGIVSGADALIGDVARFGLFAGYSHNNFNVPDRNSSGRSDNYTLGGYLATKLQAGAGAVNIHAGLSHSWNRVHTSRTVSFRGFNDSLSADYNSRLFQVFGEVGYEQQFGNTTIEPYVNLAYVNLHSGAFTEHGTSAAALSSSSQNMGVGYVSLGARAAHTFDLGSTTAKARLDIAWKHAYGDIRPSAAHAFQGSDAFTIYGAPIARDSLWVDAGLDFHLTSALTLGVSYQGQFGKGAQQNSVKARLNIGF